MGDGRNVTPHTCLVGSAANANANANVKKFFEPRIINKDARRETKTLLIIHNTQYTEYKFNSVDKPTPTPVQQGGVGITSKTIRLDDIIIKP